MADSGDSGGQGTGVDPGMGAINPLDPNQVQLQANLQEWGLQGINPRLFQSYLQQFMKNQQGQGDTPGSALQLLQQYMQSLQGQQPDQTQQTLDDIFGKGVSGAQKVTSAADKLFGSKESGNIADGPPASSFRSGYNTPDQPAQKNDQPAPATDKAPQTIDSNIVSAPPALSLGVNTNLGGSIPQGVATAGQPEIVGMGPTMGGSIGISGAAPEAAAPLATGGADLQLGSGGLSLGGVPTSYSTSSLLGQGAGSSPLLDTSLDTTGLPADVATGGGGVTGGLGALGNISAGLGALGGGYGIYNAITGTGSPLSRAASGLTGAAGLYSGVAPLVNEVFGTSLPSITEALGNMFPGLAAQMGAQAATEAGATGLGEIAGPAISSGAEAGAAAGSGAGAGVGAGAGGAVAGGIAALPALAIVAAQMTESLLDQQRATRNLKLRTKNIGTQLPGELGNLEQVPGIAGGITPSSSEADVIANLKKLNDTQSQFQAGGWEDYLKSGATTVSGGADGLDMTAKLPGVQQALFQSAQNWMPAYMAGEIRGEDILGKQGMTPDQIGAATGRYLNPIEIALAMNAQGYTPGGEPIFQNFAPTLRAELLPSFLQPGADVGPITSPTDIAALKMMGLPTTGGDGGPITGQDIQNAQGGGSWNDVFAPKSFTAASSPGMLSGYGGVTGEQNVNIGGMNPVLAQQLEAITPGNFQDQITQLLQSYGGINPSISSALGAADSGTLGATGGGGLGSSPGGGIGIGSLRSGGASDPEKGLPGAAASTTQAALGGEQNPWAQKPAGLTMQPLQTLDDLLAKAQAMGSGQA